MLPVAQPFTRCLVLLLIGTFFWSVPAVSDIPLPDNFGYAVRLLLPTHEKANLGSGFFFSHEGSTYVVTARHVLFASADVRIKEGANFPIPGHLRHRLRYNKKSRRLILDGVLSEKDRDYMLNHALTNEGGSEAIQELYEKSQHPVPKAHTATLVTCTPGTGEFELLLTAMQIKGLVRYHPDQDLAVIKLAGPEGYTPGVKMKKSGAMTALTAKDLKLSDTVAPGSKAFVLGFTPPGKQKVRIDSSSLKQPLPIEGRVMAKNKGRGILMLDCTAQPGDSGGVVLQYDEGSREKRLKGIGIVSGGFAYDKDKAEGKKMSIAIPLDALADLLIKR